MRKAFVATASMYLLGTAMPAVAQAQSMSETPRSAEPAAAATAAAQDAPPRTTERESDIDDIVVTARRSSESLQTVPISITAVSPEQIRSQQVTEINGLQRVSPSFTVTKSQRGSSSPAIMIRGQRFYNANTLGDPAATVYFGEVGQSLAAGGGSSFFDLRSIEVLKGPQGTLFGRNTTGGAVLLTPEAPSDAFDGYVQGQLGSYALRDVEGAFNLPITSTLAVRVAGKLTRRDGYLYNVVRGDRAENLHSDAARVSVRWRPTESIDSTTIGSYFADDVVNGSKLFAIAPSRLAVPAVSLPIATATLARVNGYGRYEIEDDFPQRSFTRIFGVQNSSKIDIASGLDDLYVKNIISYRNIHADANFDIDGSTFRTVFQTSKIRANIFSEEFQLGGRTGIFGFLAGVYYYRQTALDSSFSQQFASLAPALPTVFPAVNYGDYDTRNTSVAAFAHADVKLDSVVQGLSFSAGVRYTKDTRGITYHNRTSQGFTPTQWRCTLTGVTGLPDDRNLCVYDPQDLKFDEPTYDASLNWQVAKDVLIYGAYRHGYRAGGFNNSPPTPLAITSFRPEKVDDFEIGVKTKFTVGGISGRFNLAAFRDKLHDGQRAINTFVQAAPPPAPAQFVGINVNAGQGTIQGGEAELTVIPLRGLTLTSSGSLIDAKYDQFNDSYLVNGVATLVDVSDSRFAFVPRYQVNASIKYELPTSESFGKLAVQGTYYYQSAIQTAEINTANCGPNGLYPNCVNGAGALPGFDYGNLRLTLDSVGGSPVDLAVFVNNVTDRFYRPYAANALGLIGLASYTFGEPRMYGLELRVRFGRSAN